MATGDVLGLAVLGLALVDPAGRSVPYDGFAVGVTFAGMSNRDGAMAGTTPVFNPAAGKGLVIQVSDPGFDKQLNPTTIYRTIRALFPVRWPYPVVWTSGAVFAAKRYCQGATNDYAYYTTNGGTTSSAPTHTTQGTTITGADGIAWTCVGIPTHGTGLNYPSNPAPYGYFDSTAGGNVTQYAVLDGYIYAGTTIISASIDAGAYTVTTGTGTQTSSAATLIPAPSNTSTRPYEIPMAAMVSWPHARSLGSIDVELYASHAWGDLGGQMLAGAKFTAWDAARTTPSPTVLTSAPVLSNIITASSPGGSPLEVYRATLNTLAMPATDSLVEYELFPWLGTQTYKSQRDGEAADWSAKVYPRTNIVARNAGRLYFITTVPAGNVVAANAPVHTSGAVTGADGYGWTVFGTNMVTCNSSNLQARHHFLNDPTNALRKGYCFVDPNGTGGTVYSTMALANAAKTTLANCYPTVFAASAALIVYNYNGGVGPGSHNDNGGGEIYLTAATHTTWGASMRTHAAGSEWMYVRGDPAAAAGTVIFPPASPQAMSNRVWFGDNITSPNASGGIISTGADAGSTPLQIVAELYINGLAIPNTVANYTAVYNAGLVWVRNCSGTQVTFSSQNNVRSHFHDICGCNFNSANIRSMVLLGNKFRSGGPSDPPTYTRTAPQFVIHANNFFIAGGVGIAGGVASYDPPYLGLTYDTNISESLAANAKCCVIAGDNSSGALSNVVITNNGNYGERTNVGYADQSLQQTPRFNWHIFNNANWGMNSIDDTYNHQTGKVPARDGLRNGNMAITYGVRRFQNRSWGNDGGGGVVDNSGGMRLGYRTLWTSGGYAGEVVRDASNTGTGAGDGDYTPVAGSTLLGMAATTNRRFDRSGQPRFQGGAVGPLEGPNPAFRSRRGLIGASAGTSV